MLISRSVISKSSFPGGRPNMSSSEVSAHTNKREHKAIKNMHSQQYLIFLYVADKSKNRLKPHKEVKAALVNSASLYIAYMSQSFSS